MLNGIESLENDINAVVDLEATEAKYEARRTSREI